MTIAIMTLVAAVLIAVGIIGIIYPILPGSFAVLGGLAVWALSVQAPEGWWALALGGVLVIIGMTAQTLLTGRTLKRRQIPKGSVILGVIGAIIGMFFIPFVGIFVGFAVALFLSELTRQKDVRKAILDTWAALKSMGAGILVELSAALLAGSIFSVFVLIYFMTA